MKTWREKWDALWMAVTFAQAGESDTARSIYQEAFRRPEQEVERKRPAPRPRPRSYRT